MRFLRYVGRPRTEDVAYNNALEDGHNVLLDSWSNADANIANHFMLDGRRATAPLRPHARALFDLATMVFVADEIVPRRSSADQWTRDLTFHVPVVELERWQGAEQLLGDCLGFLSGDASAFTWSGR